MASAIEQTETKRSSSEERVFKSPKAPTSEKPPLRRNEPRDKPEAITDWASI